MGLQLGEGEGDGDGPGTGTSGANTIGGTDLYNTFLDTNNNSTPNFVANNFATQVRLTKNTSIQNELQGSDKTSHGSGVYYDGKVAAARANIRLIGRRAFVAWEEKRVQLVLIKENISDITLGLNLLIPLAYRLMAVL